MKKNEEIPFREGYTAEKRTISIMAANLWALLLMAVAGVLGFVAAHALGVEMSFSLTSVLIFLLAIVVCMVVHELIHGITWILLIHTGFRHLSFGFMTGAVYCHIDVPMMKRHYVIGALMPLLLVGVVPWVAGIAVGSLLWMVVGAIMIGGAAGDIMIVWAIRREPADALIYDHPKEAGCYVYHKEENT